jgi:transcriptional regulator GlxA family with amidase domain
MTQRACGLYIGPKGNIILEPARPELPELSIEFPFLARVRMSGHYCSPPSVQARSTGHDLVERAESLALANFREPLNIEGICRELTVSERTLRKHFQARRGLSPLKSLRNLRLARARNSLLSTRNRFATVTEIAHSFGFSELGRFSVEYRQMFGESPSETLRQTFCKRGFPARTLNNWPARQRIRAAATRVSAS